MNSHSLDMVCSQNINSFKYRELAGHFHCKATSIRMKLTRARRKALEFILNDEVKL